jgi:hypothetical protein
MNARLFPRLARLASVTFALGIVSTATTAHAIGAAEAPVDSESVCAELAENMNLSYGQGVEWAADDCEALGFTLAVPSIGEPGVEPTVCPKGYIATAGYCYEQCKAGYEGVSSVCWSKPGLNLPPYGIPEGPAATCPETTVMYGGLCVSNEKPSSCPPGSAPTLGPDGFYCVDSPEDVGGGSAEGSVDSILEGIGSAFGEL